MSEINAAAIHTAINSIQALGRGFDVNCDTRLLYCKGIAGSRVVEVDERTTKDFCLYDDVIVPDVPRDVKCCPEIFGRQRSGVCSFQEVWIMLFWVSMLFACVLSLMVFTTFAWLLLCVVLCCVVLSLGLLLILFVCLDINCSIVSWFSWFC